jgi:hypothetical protein
LNYFPWSVRYAESLLPLRLLGVGMLRLRVSFTTRSSLLAQHDRGKVWLFSYVEDINKPPQV